MHWRSWSAKDSHRELGLGVHPVLPTPVQNLGFACFTRFKTAFCTLASYLLACSDMGKRANKRQKIAPEAAHEQPVLGLVDPHADQAGKDDEERRLESLLFGTPYVPTGKGKGKEHEYLLELSDENGEEDAPLDGAVGGELENMLDSDVCVFSCSLVYH